MATQEDYKLSGLTDKGVRLAESLDEWIELIVAEVKEDLLRFDKDTDPWDVKDFIVRCVVAVACSQERIYKYRSNREAYRKTG